MRKNLVLQMRILVSIILLNFIAQIPYFVHLYYSPQQPFPSLRSDVLMGSVFVLFAAGYIFVEMQKKIGYLLLVFFLLLEFFFYLYSTIFSAIRGYGLFFQLANPDILLRIVFAIGYLNLFASGYFLFLLFFNRKQFLRF